MANEATINVSLKYADSNSVAAVVEALNKTATSTDKQIQHHVQSIATAETALDIGSLSATGIGWAAFRNLDTTYSINLKVAAGGAIFAQVQAGKCIVLYLGSGAQAPYAIALTQACFLEYLLIEA